MRLLLYTPRLLSSKLYSCFDLFFTVKKILVQMKQSVKTRITHSNIAGQICAYSIVLVRLPSGKTCSKSTGNALERYNLDKVSLKGTKQ